MNEMVKPEADVDEYIEAQDRLAEALIFKMTDDGPKVVPNQANAIAMLQLHPDWEGVLAYNVFTREEMLTAPIPGSPEDNGAPFEGRPLKDQDYTWALAWFDRNLAGISKQTVIDAIDAVVHEFRADPLKQYLEEVMAAWDGTERLGRFFDDYFVAEYEKDAYTTELGIKAMMTQVQRGLWPGAFQKMVPILEGKQNIGKSTGLQAMCPDRSWFSDHLPKISSKDVSIALRGKFLVEMAELAAVNRAEMEEIKGFVTRQVEQFRPPYGKREVQEPRRCMFWGTTNQDNYLRDETGSTRFYPIKIIQVNVDAIRRDRDQLLGEAAHRLVKANEAGEAWWEFSPEALAILNDTRDEKGEDHTWTSVVMQFVADRDEVAIRDILTSQLGLNFDDKKASRGDSNAVAGILKTHGWERDGKFTAGRFKDAARYVLSAEARAARQGG